MEKKLLTIAIPTWNRKKFLEITLNNFVQQVLDNKLENYIEIIVSDNASTDGTQELLDTFLEKYSAFLRINKNSENLGFGKNLEKLISLSSAKYIWCCSDDDDYDKHIVQIIYQTILDNMDTALFYIPPIQSNVDFSKVTTVHELLSTSAMCPALVSSNVFQKSSIESIKVECMTWYHVNLIFNFDNLFSKCVILPKLIKIHEPSNDPSYWHNDMKNLVDFDTEAVFMAKNSKLPRELKEKVYKHYKQCLPNEIKKYMQSNSLETDFLSKCAYRLRNINEFYMEYLKLRLRASFLYQIIYSVKTSLSNIKLNKLDKAETRVDVERERE